MIDMEKLAGLVKPLVWVRSEHKRPDQIAYHAQAIPGPYAIWTNRAQVSFIASSGGYFYQMTDTLEAAKAAAQADYTTRILAALDLTEHLRLSTSVAALTHECAQRDARIDELVRANLTLMARDGEARQLIERLTINLRATADECGDHWNSPSVDFTVAAARAFLGKAVDNG